MKSTQPRQGNPSDCEGLPLLDAGGKLRKPRARYPLDECFFSWDFGLLEWIQDLSGNFGYELLVLLSTTEHLLKGFVVTLTGQAMTFLFASYGVNASQMQIYLGIVALPWSMKPVFGLISDMFPIGGYKKQPYMLFFSVLGVASMLAIGILPQTLLSVTGLIICLMFAQTQFSVCDLLSEATYAERIQDCPRLGPSLVSYVWGGLSLMSMVAVLLSGCVIAESVRLVFVISAGVSMVVFLPIVNNYLQERKLTPEEVASERQKILQQKEACILCVVMLFANISLTVCGLVFDSVVLNAAVALVFTIILLVSFSVLLTPVVAKFNAFILVQGACSLSISSASFYFYTDSAVKYPEGPHFSIFFYSSVLGLVGSAMSLLGVFAYQRFMSKWRYRNLLIFANVFLCVLSMMDVIMFSRLNLVIGIPDHCMMLGATISESLVAQWQWMPSVVILSYLCPRGLEATMYALLAGCANFGGIVSGDFGALLLQWLQVEPRGAVGETIAFDNLWIAALISSLSPLVVIVLLFWLIPDARQDEKLLSDDADASSGSLFQRWFGSHSTPPAAEAVLESSCERPKPDLHPNA